MELVTLENKAVADLEAALGAVFSALVEPFRSAAAQRAGAPGSRARPQRRGPGARQPPAPSLDEAMLASMGHELAAVRPLSRQPLLAQQPLGGSRPRSANRSAEAATLGKCSSPLILDNFRVIWAGCARSSRTGLLSPRRTRSRARLWNKSRWKTGAPSRTNGRSRTSSSRKSSATRHASSRTAPSSSNQLRLGGYGSSARVRPTRSGPAAPASRRGRGF